MKASNSLVEILTAELAGKGWRASLETTNGIPHVSAMVDDEERERWRPVAEFMLAAMLHDGTVKIIHDTCEKLRRSAIGRADA